MAYSQGNRPLVLQTALGADAFVVTGVSGTEELSRPFHFTIDLASDRPSVDASALLGKPAALTMKAPSGHERLVHGRVSRFRRVGAGSAVTSYQLELVGWPWLLSLSSDCRIFQRMAVPEIVSTVFSELGFSDFVLRLVRSHPPREFCVQYRESHLDFVSRLLEDEGIFYFFEHESSRHTLVLTDTSSILQPCPGCDTLRAAAGGLVRAVADQYTGLVVERAVQTRAVAMSDYNYLAPAALLDVSLAARDGMGEAFDYPGGYAEAAEGDRLARLRLERVDAARELARGTSNAPALATGYTVQLPDAATSSGDHAWLIVGVQHTVRQPPPLAATEGAEEFVFESAFTLAPASVPWRPPLVTPRPRVYGTQCALVVGVAGEEIYTDAQGRVKLHFYWDRRSPRNENSSCWVRCSFAWAGQGYGQFSVPRMGQEVLVDFLEGDPDRPVVVGRVYNAEQPPPCDPGGSRGVVSGMRSKSHKGGGYNEMSMDDTKGKEKISIHAQYDMVTAVEHDDTQTVKNNRTVKIAEGNLSEDVVAGTATYHVKGAVAEQFEATQATTVKSDITIVSQTGGIAIAADAQHVYIKGTTNIQLRVGSSMIWMDSGGQIGIEGVNVTIKGSSNVTIKGGTVHSEADSQHQTIGAIVLSDGSATNTVKGGMVMLNP